MTFQLFVIIVLSCISGLIPGYYIRHLMAKLDSKKNLAAHKDAMEAEFNKTFKAGYEAGKIEGAKQGRNEKNNTN